MNKIIHQILNNSAEYVISPTQKKIQFKYYYVNHESHIHNDQARCCKK